MSGKGGRKRGANFARYSLKDMTDNTKTICNVAAGQKLTAKKLATAVLGAGTLTGTAKTKIAALRHYGLLQGTNAALEPTEICRKLPLAKNDERTTLLQRAFLCCKPFKAVYGNYAGTKQPRSNIGTYAMTEERINADNEEQFVNVFVESLEYSGLGEVSGDEIQFQQAALPAEELIETEDENSEDQVSLEGEVAGFATQTEVSKPRVVVNINVDPTLDPDKLEKQLTLLKKYGAL